MYKYLFVFLIFITNSQAQTYNNNEYNITHTDSIVNNSKELSPEKKLVKYRNILENNEYAYISSPLIQAYCHISQQMKSNRDIALCRYYKALHLTNANKYKQAADILNKANRYFLQTKDWHYRFLSLLHKGHLYNLQNKIDSANFYFEQAKSLVRTPDEKYRLHYQLGIYNILNSRLKKAVKHLNSAYEIAEQEKDEIRKLKVLYRLANINIIHAKYKEACKTLKSVEEKFIKLHKIDLDLAYLYFIQGNCHKFLSETQKALKAYLHALKIFKKYRNKLSTAYTYSALGMIDIKLKRYNKARQYLDSALYLLEQINDEKYTATVYSRKAIMYYHLNNKEKALLYSKKALNIALKNRQFDKIYAGYNNIGYLHSELGNYKKAYKNAQLATRYKDSFLSDKYYKNLNEIQVKYQTKEKETQILQLSNENLKKEAELNQTKNIVYLTTGILVILAATGFFLWHRRKQQQKLALLQAGIQATEAEKNHIGKELHDGIAGNLIRLVHEIEDKDIALADKLLKTYHEVRNLSHQLNNTPMHGEILFDRLLEAIPESNDKQSFHLHITPPDIILPEPVGTHVFRIIQELITNNLKHAHAGFTTIEIKQKDNKLHILYFDDGKGTKKLKKGSGLKNIEDRIALMKGKINYKTGNGFGVKIEIPL